MKMFKIHNYMVGKVLAKSQFSSIRYTRRNDINKEFISKCLNKSNISAEMLKNESVVAPLLSHPNILPIREVIDTQNLLFQITDFCPCGDLLSYITSKRTVSPECAIYQLLMAVNYLHTHYICHSDIKLENIMIGNDNYFKLADFGLSLVSFDGKVNEPRGSFQYVAPEALREKSYNGFKADIWSAGVVAYAILTKTFPYKDVSNVTTINFSTIEEKWRPLISSMLSINPEDRPTARQCLQNSAFASQIPPFKQLEPINITAPLLVSNLEIISRVSQIYNLTAQETNLEISKVGPSEIKLLTSLFMEREKKNQDGFVLSPVRCQSQPIPSIPQLSSTIIRRYSADSNDVLEKIKSFLMPINGCITTPALNTRSIVLNTPTETESVIFDCSMYDENETEVRFCQSSINRDFIQDICKILDASFDRVQGLPSIYV